MVTIYFARKKRKFITISVFFELVTYVLFYLQKKYPNTNHWNHWYYEQNPFVHVEIIPNSQNMRCLKSTRMWACYSIFMIFFCAIIKHHLRFNEEIKKKTAHVSIFSVRWNLAIIKLSEANRPKMSTVAIFHFWNKKWIDNWK